MRFINSLKDITLKSWNPLAQSNQYYLIYHPLVKFRLLWGQNAFVVFKKVLDRKINAKIRVFCTVFKEALYMLLLYDTLKSLTL